MSAMPALRTDLLVRLEEGGALSAVGLDLSERPDLTFAQYTSIGVLLGKMTSALRFAVGDWLAFGEDRFGENAAQASEALGISPEARMEYIRIARAIPRSQRRPGLSWNHHRLLAGRWLEPAQRDELLDRAEQNGWNVRELEGVVRERRALGLHVEDVRDACDYAVEDAARDLRAQLRRCGFGDDLAVEITVTAGPVVMAVRIP